MPFAPGILCAQGLIVSDLRETFVRTAVTPLSDPRMGDVRARIGELKAQADAWFDAERVERANRSVDIVLDARYVGQNFELAIELGTAVAGLRDGLFDLRLHPAARGWQRNMSGR